MKNFLYNLRSKKIPLNQSILLKNSIKFCINECIVGDYYEFGVFQGSTTISASLYFNQIVNKRLSSNQNSSDEASRMRSYFRDNLKFHCFDSFEGLPQLTSNDLYSNDFEAKQYSCSLESFKNNIESFNLNISKFIFYPGWFSDTASQLNGLGKASIIWLDCDLYSSSRDVFRHLHHILQDGTILIIDDWFSFKGNPTKGVQSAFNKWLLSDNIKNKFIVNEYQRDDWKRNSFIVNTI